MLDVAKTDNNVNWIFSTKREEKKKHGKNVMNA